MVFRPPVSPRLADAIAEQVRRDQHDKIVEIQTALTNHPPGSGAYLGRALVTASANLQLAAGCKSVVMYFCVGGVGGVGHPGGAGGLAFGDGGSSGWGLIVSLTSSLVLSTVIVTIGGAGAGGANTGGNGTAGGDTVVSLAGLSWTAKGGGGGVGMGNGTSATQNSNGTVPPAGSTIDSHVLAAQAQYGTQGVRISAALGWPGVGGSGMFGAGTPSGGNTSGAQGSGYGAGGSGAEVVTNASGQIGGFGTGGVWAADMWG
jgi:hypothetical protein